MIQSQEDIEQYIQDAINAGLQTIRNEQSQVIDAQAKRIGNLEQNLAELRWTQRSNIATCKHSHCSQNVWI